MPSLAVEWEGVGGTIYSPVDRKVIILREDVHQLHTQKKVITKCVLYTGVKSCLFNLHIACSLGMER